MGKIPEPMSDEKRTQLRELYHSSVSQPAAQCFTHFQDPITAVLPGRAWVLPLLSPDECEDIVQRGETHGLREARDGFKARTSKRTNDFMHEQLSALVGRRLPMQMLEELEATEPYTAVRGLHPNWRVARYDVGDSFAAHYDNSDLLSVDCGEGCSEKL